MDVTFIVTTQKDRGISKRLLSQVNSHVATIKHARPKAAQKAIMARSTTYIVKPGPSDAPNKTLSPSLQAKPNKGRFGSNHDKEDEEALASQGAFHTKSTGHTFDPDQQLLSSLDPLLGLPINLSPRERSLLHFWLTDGRRYAFNTSLKPEYCPAINTAQRLLDKSPIYILVHIVTAEALQCQLRGDPRSVSPAFYLRRAQAYQAMNKMLDDREATFHDKMTDLIQLASLEFILGQPELQARHIQALQTYIKKMGGMAYIMSQRHGLGKRTLGWEWYLAIDLQLNLSTEVCIPTADALEGILDRFTCSLKETREWIYARVAELSQTSSHLRNSHFQKQRSNQPLNSDPHLRLTILRSYLRWLINTNLSPQPHDVRYRGQTGTFNTIYQLCMLQVKIDYNASQSLQFLKKFERVIEHSTQVSTTEVTGGKSRSTGKPGEQDDFCRYRLNTTAAACALCYLRYELPFPPRPEVDIDFFDVSAHASRLLPLMSWHTRLVLSEQFVRCACLVADVTRSLQETASVPDFTDYFGDEQIQQLKHEIRANWMRKNASQSPLLSNLSLIDQDDSHSIEVDGIG